VDERALLFAGLARLPAARAHSGADLDGAAFAAFGLAVLVFKSEFPREGPRTFAVLNGPGFFGYAELAPRPSVAVRNSV
jgi:hypothetical protein